MLKSRLKRKSYKLKRICYSLSIQVTLSWVGGVAPGPLIEDEELRTSV